MIGTLIMSIVAIAFLSTIFKFITFSIFPDEVYTLIAGIIVGIFVILSFVFNFIDFFNIDIDHIFNKLEKMKSKIMKRKNLKNRMNNIENITKELDVIKKEYGLEKDDSLLELFNPQQRIMYMTNEDKYDFIIEQEEKANALFENYKHYFKLNENGIFFKNIYYKPKFSEYKYEPEDIEFLKNIYPMSPEDIEKIIKRRLSCLNVIRDLSQKIKIETITTKKGKHGEDSVNKFLNYYKDNYIILDNILVDFEGETSESDVIIICDKGIFVVEVKNHGNANSTISISSDGRWSTIKNGKKELKDNVSAQNNRHCAINQTILNRELKNRGIEVDYIKCNSIIVIANDKVEIKNESTNAVLRTSEIITYIENLKTDTKLPKNIQEEIADIFKSKNLPPKKFPVVDLYNDYSNALEEFERAEMILTGYEQLESAYMKYLK